MKYLKRLKKESINYQTINYNDDVFLRFENVERSLTKKVVKYLSYLMYLKGSNQFNDNTINLIFQNAISGYLKRENYVNNKRNLDNINDYLANIKGLDEVSIINTYKVVTFESWLKDPSDAINDTQAINILPDEDTIFNVIIMVKRTLSFLIELKETPKFNFNSLNKEVVDIECANFLFNLKISMKEITDSDFEKIMKVYEHSSSTINEVGIFNPRLNIKYVIDINK